MFPILTMMTNLFLMITRLVVAHALVHVRVIAIIHVQELVTAAAVAAVNIAVLVAANL